MPHARILSNSCFQQLYFDMQICDTAGTYHQERHLKMSKRSAGEGTATSSSLSKRPGRRRAESRAAMRLVAAMTTTPEVPARHAFRSLSDLPRNKNASTAGCVQLCSLREVLNAFHPVTVPIISTQATWSRCLTVCKNNCRRSQTRINRNRSLYFG